MLGELRNRTRKLAGNGDTSVQQNGPQLPGGRASFFEGLISVLLLAVEGAA
jgi:hypothetical protein